MQEYVVTYRRGADVLVHTLFAKDRDDAIEFTRRQAKVPIKIKSAKLVNKIKSKGGRPRKVINLPAAEVDAKDLQGFYHQDTEPPRELYSELMAKALQRMQAAPFSGIAIANYFKQVMAGDPDPANVKRAVMTVIRAVEAYEDKLVQNKKVAR